MLYDGDTNSSDKSELSGLDGITVSPWGDLLISEDGDDMQVLALTADRGPVPILQLCGQDHSEVTGVCFSPDATRMYLHSQRGNHQSASTRNIGVTYEVTGFADVGLPTRTT